MRKHSLLIFKTLLSLVLLIGSLSLKAQTNVRVSVWQNASGSKMVNYPVWAVVRSTPQFVVSGYTDTNGMFIDTISGITGSIPVTIVTYDCSGNRVTKNQIINPSTPMLTDTLVVGCVGPVPSYNVSASAIMDIANPLAFDFKGVAVPVALPSDLMATHIWNFGDGTSTAALLSPDTNYAYNNPGNYMACLTFRLNDTVLGFMPFSIMDCINLQAGNPSLNCQANFQYANLPPSAVFSFSDSSLINVPAGGHVSYLWTFGDGATDTAQNPVHTYLIPGNYNVCLQIDIRDGQGTVVCSDTFCKNVVYNGSAMGCTARFTGSASNFTVNFDASASTSGSGVPSQYSWDFGDSTTGTGLNISHTYSSAGSYQVCLTFSAFDSVLQQTCTDTICQVITICKAHYIVDTTNSFFGTVYIWNDSKPEYFNANYTNSYLWDFGDGTTSSQPYPVHPYATPGVYPVCLTIYTENGLGDTCSDTFCDTLGVDSLGRLIYKNTTTQFVLKVLNPETIGLAEYGAKETLSVYPNPASDRITIEWGNLQKPLNWEITDLKGATLLAGTEEVAKRRKAEIDVSQLRAGVYILTTYNSEQTVAHYKLRIN